MVSQLNVRDIEGYRVQSGGIDLHLLGSSDIKLGLPRSINFLIHMGQATRSTWT